MNPEERQLLERLAQISEENNRILKDVHSILRWSRLWGFVKIAIIIVPFVIGYIFLEPYLGSVGDSLKQAQELYNSF
jgi:hypothetical protein